MKACSRTNCFLLFIFFSSIIYHPGLFAGGHTGTSDHPSILNRADLEAFMDGVMQSQMDKHNLTGASVGILHDGETLLLKGYGYADVDRKIPVDPEVSLFRIGSISKLFTWIAVLQQLEKGRLDLDQDINAYLQPFQIPADYDDPVTLRSLMSHTPGFEDILLKLFIREGSEMPPLETLFSDQLPKRIMPPLQEAAYSNHGTGLAQYIVERVSGMPFEQYAEKYILEPLGMVCTTFEQPIPANMEAYMTKAYAYRDGLFEEKGFEVVPMTGAGGASTTAKDMLTFMRALLNDTRLDTISLMDSTTYAIMREPVITHAPGMNPALHGYMDMSLRHLEVIGHGGNTFLFHSLLALLPGHQTGIFLTFSGEDGAGAYGEVFKQIADRYFPDAIPAPDAIALDKQYLKGFGGKYYANRRPHSDILKVIGYMNPVQLAVKDSELFFHDQRGHVHHLTPVDSTTFYIPKENIFIGFERNSDNKATKLYISNRPIVAYERLSFINNPSLHTIIFFITIVCIVYIVFVWPWLYFVRRNYERNPRSAHPLPWFTKLIAWLAACCLFIFAVVLLLAGNTGTDIIFGIPSGIRTALVLPFIAMPFIFLMIWNSLIIWKASQIKKLSKLFYNLATLAFIITIWQLHFWNLLGWRF